MANPLTSIVEYFRSAKAELEKVSWPSRQQTLRYGTVVIVVSALAAGVFTSVDFALSHTISAVLAARNGTATQGANAPTAPNPEPVTPTTAPVSAQGVDANGKPAEIQITPASDNSTITVPAPSKTPTPAPTPAPAPAPKPTK